MARYDQASLSKITTSMENLLGFLNKWGPLKLKYALEAIGVEYDKERRRAKLVEVHSQSGDTNTLWLKIGVRDIARNMISPNWENSEIFESYIGGNLSSSEKFSFEKLPERLTQILELPILEATNSNYKVVVKSNSLILGMNDPDSGWKVRQYPCRKENKPGSVSEADVPNLLLESGAVVDMRATGIDQLFQEILVLCFVSLRMDLRQPVSYNDRVLAAALPRIMEDYGLTDIDEVAARGSRSPGYIDSRRSGFMAHNLIMINRMIFAMNFDAGSEYKGEKA